MEKLGNKPKIDWRKYDLSPHESQKKARSPQKVLKVTLDVDPVPQSAQKSPDGRKQIWNMKKYIPMRPKDYKQAQSHHIEQEKPYFMDSKNAMESNNREDQY